MSKYKGNLHLIVLHFLNFICYECEGGFIFQQYISFYIIALVIWQPNSCVFFCTLFLLDQQLEKYLRSEEEQ